MTKAELENALRNDILNSICEFLSQKYDTDVLPISTGGVTMPLLDAEGNEKFANITISIPRGTRNGNGYTEYDGYAAAEAYRLECEEKAAKRAASAAKKEAAEKLREQKRAMRAKNNPTNVTKENEIAV